MHIAVCDDNVADRKQLERLLGRESDRRSSSTGVFYTDSFGNPEHLMQNPMLYNLFFIDIVNAEPRGLDLMLRMIRAGITAPIVLCSSSINYQAALQALPEEYPTVLHLQKPILVAKLQETLDYAIELQKDILPTIELRGETETRYVLEDDIISGTMEGRMLHILLKDGHEIPIRTDFDNFFSQISCFTHFAETSPHAFINVSYIKDMGLRKITLQNGSCFKLSPSLIPYIRSVYHYYKETEGIS